MYARSTMMTAVFGQCSAASATTPSLRTLIHVASTRLLWPGYYYSFGSPRLALLRSFATPAQDDLTDVTTSSTSLSPSSGHDHYNNHHNHRRRRRQQQQRRRLDVAIVGAPNAGKSQLLNVLTQAPIAAVSRKRHTTRTGDILGARTTITHHQKQIDDNNDESAATTTTQIVFKDTPGFLRLENAKEERLDRDLIVTAAAEMQHVDFTLIVVDAARILTDNYQHALVQLMVGALGSQGRIEEDYDDDDEDDHDEDNDDDDDNHYDDGNNYDANDSVKGAPTPREKLTQTSTITPKFAVVLNKVDLVKNKFDLLPFAETIGTLADACLLDRYRPDILAKTNHLMDVVPITFYVSALEEDGTDELFDYLVELATPCRFWAVPLGQTTNQTPLEQVKEVIREKIYRCTHREVPHSVEQVNRLFETKRRRRQIGRNSDDDDESTEMVLVVHQDLVVFTKSHQRLVTGSAGRTLQRIQESAQRDLQTLFGCDVLLELHVKLNKSKQRRRAGDGGMDHSPLNDRSVQSF